MTIAAYIAVQSVFVDDAVGRLCLQRIDAPFASLYGCVGVLVFARGAECSGAVWRIARLVGMDVRLLRCRSGSVVVIGIGVRYRYYRIPRRRPVFESAALFVVGDVVEVGVDVWADGRPVVGAAPLGGRSHRGVAVGRLSLVAAAEGLRAVGGGGGFGPVFLRCLLQEKMKGQRT